MREEQLDPEFEALLDQLKRSRGFDFPAYKRASLMRRVDKRMQSVGIERYSDYSDYLEVHPDEFTQLFNIILINVTGFFRDTAAWEFLDAEILPRMINGKNRHEHIRVWSAGCASGEEAYSVAMLLAERLGVEQLAERIKIYATDVDEDALTKARHGSYTPKEVEDIPPPLLEKYFERGPTIYTFDRNIRRALIFGRHDLLQDAPISKVDLLICRNTLMYFNAEAQSRILTRLHFSLNDGGFLFLGKAEMMLTHGHAFVPVDLRRRIFTNAPKTHVRDRLLLGGQAGTEEAVNHLLGHVRLRDSAFDVDPNAALVIDAAGVLTLATDRAKALFGLTSRDLGRSLADLEVAHKPVQLRSHIDQVLANGEPLVLKDVEWPAPSGEPRHFDVHVLPLRDRGPANLGVKVVFVDVTLFRRVQDDLHHSQQEMETVNEELQSSNEEMETTNEELQSTVEELETTNEELHSANEELETMNEELQSTNQELEAVNEQLSQRTTDVSDSNAFLQSVLASLHWVVVVLDEDLRVITWSRRAEDLWGVRRDEALGQHFLNMDMGLPVTQLRQPIQAALMGELQDRVLMLDATNRRGKKIRCQVSISRLIGTAPAEVRGVILLIEEQTALKEEATAWKGAGDN